MTEAHQQISVNEDSKKVVCSCKFNCGTDTQITIIKVRLVPIVVRSCNVAAIAIGVIVIIHQ